MSLLFLPNFLFGQLYEVSLDEKIQKSSLIVEGRITESKCYRADDGNIYTANTLALVSTLKGTYPEKTLNITTWGGEMDGENQSWTHLLSLEKSEYGLFFLEATQSPVENKMSQNMVFDVFSGVQGFVQFVQNDAKAWIGQEPFHTYKNIKKELYDYIAKQTKQPQHYVAGRQSTWKAGIRFHFSDIVYEGGYVNFKLYVNSLLDEKKLAKTAIFMQYNPDFCGENIVAMSNFEIDAAGISGNANYDVAKSDASNTKVKMEANHNGVQTANAPVISTEEQLLLVGRIKLANGAASPSMFYDLSQMQFLNKYYHTDDLEQIPFDTIIVDGDWGQVPTAEPNIELISPKIVSGGTDETITITGSNFGNYVEGQSKVWFYDASEGQTPVHLVEPLHGDYNYWDNNKIIVQVPSYAKRTDSTQFTIAHYAGSGLVKVCNASGECSFPTSLDIVTVKFSVLNDRTNATDIPKNAGLPSILRNSNGEHAISIKFAADFQADPDAKASVMRAINTWKCATKVNWNTNSNAPNNDNSDMGLVYYENLPFGTTGTTWATTHLDIAKCKDNSSGEYIQVYQIYFKVGFNQNITFWHKQESVAGLDSSKIDMQTVALHEFGHAQNLRHVNAETDVMYYAIGKEEEKRTLEPFDIEGGKWVIAKSFAIILNSNCLPQMYPADISGLDCSSVGTYYPTSNGQIISYPNPVEDFLFLQIPESKLSTQAIEVFNIIGQKVANRVASGHEVQEGIRLDTSNLSAGIYIVRIQVTENSFSSVKIVKQ